MFKGSVLTNILLLNEGKITFSTFKEILCIQKMEENTKQILSISNTKDTNGNAREN